MAGSPTFIKGEREPSIGNLRRELDDEVSP
jgi:hypothetical protein